MPFVKETSDFGLEKVFFFWAHEYMLFIYYIQVHSFEAKGGLTRVACRDISAIPVAVLLRKSCAVHWPTKC